MFERFTEKARRVMVLAQDEARLMDNDFIGTEHLLLGMLAEGQGVAGKALVSFGLALPDVRDKVEARVGRAKGGTGGGGKPPFTSRAKRVLELSLREAMRLGHNYIGTEHMLLGMVREGQGVGCQVLGDMGVQLSDVRDQVLALLSGHNPESVDVGPGEVQLRMGELRNVAPRHLTTPVIEAMTNAARLAGSQPVTTAHLLLALLGRDASQAAKALAALKVTKPAVEAKLAEIPVESTSDATPTPKTVEIKFGEISTVINNPELAAGLRSVSTEDLVAALEDLIARGAVAPGVGPAPDPFDPEPPPSDPSDAGPD